MTAMTMMTLKGPNEGIKKMKKKRSRREEIIEERVRKVRSELGYEFKFETEGQREKEKENKVKKKREEEIE